VPQHARTSGTATTSKAFYKLLRDSAKRPAVLVTEPGWQPRQVTDYLLCIECEDRFNRNSEVGDPDAGARRRVPGTGCAHFGDYLLGNAGFRIFAGRAINGIDIDQLGYFSLMYSGVRRLISGAQSERPSRELDLSPYEGGLRRFLLGMAEFPRDASLW
jgi:hypothetical protein